jgi:hypothetical protein
MTKRQYRTAQGKIVDLGALLLQNEDVRAVGNMGVNARGDLVDHNNRPLSRRTQQVSKQYSRQTTNVGDAPVAASRRQAQAQADEPVAVVPVPVLETPAPAADPVVKTQASEGGLAAAIAKARQIKQEPLKSARQQARSTPGIRKI